MIPRVRLRLALLALSLFALCLGACSSAGRSTRAVPFLAPSSAAVVGSIDRTKAAAGAAAKASREVRVAIRDAQASAQRIVTLAPQTKPEVDTLTAQLVAADARASEAEERASEAAAKAGDAKVETAKFQAQVEQQTTLLNTTNAARVTAENRADRAEVTLRSVRSQRNWLLAIVVAAVLFLFRRPIGALFGIPIP